MTLHEETTLASRILESIHPLNTEGFAEAACNLARLVIAPERYADELAEAEARPVNVESIMDRLRDVKPGYDVAADVLRLVQLILWYKSGAEAWRNQVDAIGHNLHRVRMDLDQANRVLKWMREKEFEAVASGEARHG